MPLTKRHKHRRIPFDAPGKATGWGMAGCLICTVTASFGFWWAAAITVVTALAGCWNGGS